MSASWRRQSCSRETSGVLHWAGQLKAQLLPRARLLTCWSLPGCCLYLPPAWQNWLYLNIDESHFCAFQCFIPAGWILVTPFTLGLLMLHASLVGLFLGLLKKIELFGRWSGAVIEEEEKKKKEKPQGLGNILVINWVEQISKLSLFWLDYLSI